MRVIRTSTKVWTTYAPTGWAMRGHWRPHATDRRRWGATAGLWRQMYHATRLLRITGS